jgi:hypothetical protein
MQRRSLLGLGVAGGALLALAGGGLAWMYEAAWREGQLLPAGRSVLGAVARAMLEGSLPDQPGLRDQAIDAHLLRMQALLSALPPHTQAEVADLLALLALPPARMAVCGLASSWDEAPAADVESALQSMRVSSWMLRRQAYGALRELTYAAYFGDVATWPLLRYPGPRALP